MATQPILPGAVLAGDHVSHYVDWAAIFGGVAIAAGISIVLFTFGSAIGFSMVSPYDGEGLPRAVYFTVLGLWTLWVVVSSFMGGGYVAGRLRRRIGDGTEHEVDVRDGAHGLIVWGVGIVIFSILLVVGVAGALGSGSKGIANDDGRSDPIAYSVDALFRATDRAAGAVATDGDRREVARILTLGSLRGELTADNKTYVTRLISARTGLSQADAERRLNQVLTDAKRKADAARKTGIVIGFLTAAALLVAGAATAWAATLGGRHRDQGTHTAYFWRWQ